MVKRADRGSERPTWGSGAQIDSLGGQPVGLEGVAGGMEKRRKVKM